MFDGNLRQQKSASAMSADQETMAADFDFICLNWLRWRENAQLYFESQRLFDCDRRKPVVIEGSGACGLRNCAVDRATGKHVADTPTQFFFSAVFFLRIFLLESVTQIQRSESAARFSKMRSRRIQTNLSMLKRGKNGIVRQAKQLEALFMGEFVTAECPAWSRTGCSALGAWPRRVHGQLRIRLWERHRHLPHARLPGAFGDG